MEGDSAGGGRDWWGGGCRGQGGGDLRVDEVGEVEDGGEETGDSGGVLVGGLVREEGGKGEGYKEMGSKIVKTKRGIGGRMEVIVGDLGGLEVWWCDPLGFWKGA